jgi:hypothetical protein
LLHFQGIGRERMRHLVVFALAPLVALGAGDKKRKEPLAPRVEVLELTAKRTAERTVEIDGRVEASGRNEDVLSVAKPGPYTIE